MNYILALFNPFTYFRLAGLLCMTVARKLTDGRALEFYESIELKLSSTPIIKMLFVSDGWLATKFRELRMHKLSKLIDVDPDYSGMKNPINIDGMSDGEPARMLYHTLTRKALIDTIIERAESLSRFFYIAFMLIVVAWTAYALAGASIGIESSSISILGLNILLHLAVYLFAMTLTCLVAQIFAHVIQNLVFKSLVTNWVLGHIQKDVEPMRHRPWSSTRFKHRREQIEAFDRARDSQLAEVKRTCASPLLHIGTADGLLESRGLISAYEKGSDVELSLDDASQHILVLGGTGEGKTRNVLRPLIKQLKELDGCTTFVMDDKSLLWRELDQKTATIIGADAGQKVVDLLDGVPPFRLERMLLSACGGKDSKDSFWSEIAANYIRCIAELCSVYAETDAGAEACEQAGCKAYSFVMIYKLATSSTARKKAIDDTMAAVENKSINTAELGIDEAWWSALEYLQNDFEDLAKETRTSILANVTNMIAGFASNDRIRSTFGCGGHGCETVTMREIVRAKSGQFGVALDALRDGSAARISLIFIKALLMNEARLYELDDPNCSSVRKLFLIVDECQGIVTASKDGYSDSTFWNVARSAGICGVYATQNMAALKVAMGNEQTVNFIGCFRTKIFLKAEDADIYKLCDDILGTTLRKVCRNGVFETWHAITDAFGLSRNIYKWNVSAFNAAFSTSKLDLSYINQQKKYGLDLYSTNDANGRASAMNQEIQFQVQQMQRHDDLEKADEIDGVTEKNVIRKEDITAMPRGHAICIVQRAGLVQADFVTLEKKEVEL